MNFRSFQKASESGMLMHALLWRLGSIGIVIEPYFLIEEGEFDEPASVFGSGDSLRCKWLDADELEEIDFLESDDSSESFRRRLESGHLCLGVRDGSQIVAYMWCDLEMFNHAPLRFTLAANEAYLYDARVSPQFRGRGIAVFMRRNCYRMLRSLSKQNFYSYSDYANRPAIRFKQKLGARFLALYVYIDLWGRFSRNWKLRDYRSAPFR